MAARNLGIEMDDAPVGSCRKNRVSVVSIRPGYLQFFETHEFFAITGGNR
jgi:hypothetical protein